jgi:hypothetical protein
MSVMVLDAGNSIIKAKIARRERSEVAFPHALRPLPAVSFPMVVNLPKVLRLYPHRVDRLTLLAGHAAVAG